MKRMKRILQKLKRIIIIPIVLMGQQVKATVALPYAPAPVVKTNTPLLLKIIEMIISIVLSPIMIIITFLLGIVLMIINKSRKKYIYILAAISFIIGVILIIIKIFMVRG